MKFFKSMFLSQIERAQNIGEGRELYFIYFRLTQLLAVASFIFAAVMVQRFVFDADFFPISSFAVRYLLLAVAAWGLRVVVCEVGLRCLDKEKSIGVLIGLILSALQLPGWSFMLGLFGFYAFLNPSSQRRFLGNAPQWVKEFLTFCHINHLKGPTAAATKDNES